MSWHIRLLSIILSVVFTLTPIIAQDADPEALTPDALAELINRQVATTINHVNVRAEAASSGELLIGLDPQQPVKVVGVIETDSTQYPIWYEIVLDDKRTGFVWSGLFSELETIAPITVEPFGVDWPVLDGIITGIAAFATDYGEDAAQNLLLNYAPHLLNDEIQLIDGLVVNRAREIYNVEQGIWEYDPMVATMMLDPGEALYLNILGDEPLIVTQIIEDEAGHTRVVFAQPDSDSINDGRVYPAGQLSWNLTGDEFQHAFDMLWAHTYSAFIKNFPDATTSNGQTYSAYLGISEIGSAQEIEISLRLMREAGQAWPLLLDFRGHPVNPNLPVMMVTMPAAEAYVWGAGRIYPIIQVTKRLIGGYVVDDYGQVYLLGLVDDNFQVKYGTLITYTGNLLYLSMEISTGQRPIFNAELPEWSGEFYERLGLNLMTLRTDSVSYR